MLKLFFTTLLLWVANSSFATTDTLSSLKVYDGGTWTFVHPEKWKIDSSPEEGYWIALYIPDDNNGYQGVVLLEAYSEKNGQEMPFARIPMGKGASCPIENPERYQTSKYTNEQGTYTVFDYDGEACENKLHFYAATWHYEDKVFTLRGAINVPYIDKYKVDILKVFDSFRIKK